MTILLIPDGYPRPHIRWEWRSPIAIVMEMGMEIVFKLQLSKSMLPDPDNVELWLKVDGDIRQKGSTKDMIFRIPYLVSHVSSIMTLFEGDVILTGTPQGVGPVKEGEKITAGITGLLDIHFNVEKRRKPGSC